MQVQIINTIHHRKFVQNPTLIQANNSDNTNINNEKYSDFSWQIPIISFKQKINSINYKMIDLLMKNEYKSYSETTILNKEGKPEKAHIFYKKNICDDDNESEYIDIVLTNNNYDYIGGTCGYVNTDNYCYLSIINNFANTHNEYSCDDCKHYLKRNHKEHIEQQYKRVGTKVYEAFEDIIRKNYPKVKYIECCPVRDGSTEFFIQKGFKWSHTIDVLKAVSDMTDDDCYHYQYYRKYF